MPMRIKQIRAAGVDLAARPTTPPRVAAVTDGAGGGPRRFNHPLDRYPRASRGKVGKGGQASSWPRVACVATAEDGTCGLGLTLHGAPVTALINDHFAPLLVGQPVTATEKAWDLMRRAASQFGVAGLASYAMSAIDLALWDLKGKLLRSPVYELLGGPQKERIFCYASNTDLTYGMEPSLEWFLELGFRAVKIFLTEGPEQGLAGLRRTEERVARARELVGDDVELAVDGWLSLDVEYAVRLGEALRPYRIKWLEDFLPADDAEGYAAVRRRLPGVTLASGEHWHGVGSFAGAVERRLVDILQPDLQWCGGLSNAVRICHLADAAGLSVIAHAGMNPPFGQHLSFAMPAVTWGERSEAVAPPGVPLEEMVYLPGTPVIRDGYLIPSDAPGFGIEATPDWLEARTL